MRFLPACILLSATAQASSYRFGATQERVVSDEAQGYTQHVTPDFEVQDGIAVTWVRVGRARVARLVSADYAASVYTDVAPLDGADGKITAGDAWISQQASSGALSLAVTPTAAERLLLSGARRILYESAPTTAYFASDHLGSLTVETDDQGAVVGRRGYSTWGGERVASGDGDRYGFTGQRQDPGGTLHFSFRQLDPETGRWSSTDPLFQVAHPDNFDAFGEATTSYAYVANNPSNHVDPTGQRVEAPRAPGYLTRKMAGWGFKGARTKVERYESQAKAFRGLERLHALSDRLAKNIEKLKKAGSTEQGQTIPSHDARAFEVSRQIRTKLDGLLDKQADRVMPTSEIRFDRYGTEDRYGFEARAMAGSNARIAEKLTTFIREAESDYLKL